jgi:hypothetical protein
MMTITFEHAINALKVLDTDAARQCASDYAKGLVVPTFPPLGEMSASDARQLYAFRSEVARSSGAIVSGVEETDKALHQLPQEAAVYIAGFSGSNVLFTMFLSSVGHPISCLSVESSKDDRAVHRE